MRSNGFQSRALFIEPNGLLPYGVASRFVIRLKALIDERFDSLRSFIREAEKGRGEDSGVSYLSQVLRAKNPKPPPLDRVRDWGKALGLKGEELDHFVTLAHLAHAPIDIELDFLAMRKEIAELREIVRKLREDLDAE